MAITLCIETSGPHCSLALAAHEQIFTQQRMLNRSHNQHLLDMLDTLFEQAQLAPTDVQLIAFGCGPGSFTGVRIAAAVTQAVALASQALVVPVASSRVWALSARQQQSHFSRWICCIPSRGDAYYLAAYGLDKDAPAQLSCLHTDELVDSPPNWLVSQMVGEEMTTAVIGSAPGWLPESVKSAFVEDVQPSAEAMVEWARQAHRHGHSVPAEQALPTYVAGDSPWRKRS